MPDIPAFGYALILLLLGVLLVFTLGTRRNIRRGNAFLVWLQDGLPLLGRRTTFRWMGSTAAVLHIEEAKDPFREAEVVVVLEPRDVTVLWAWSRSKGRRDFVILRGWLRHTPRFELEAGDESGWTGTDRLRKLDPEAWKRADWGQVRVAHTGDAHPEEMRRAWEQLADATGGVWRLSVRREHPHLEVHVLPPQAGVSSRQLVETFRDLGRTVTG
jgi:hypothetical protein